ncbi:uncharacterized protein LOC144619467 [Crassostrea virginica]
MQRSPEFSPLILTALLISQGLDPIHTTVTVPAPHLLVVAIVGTVALYAFELLPPTWAAGILAAVAIFVLSKDKDSVSVESIPTPPRTTPRSENNDIGGAGRALTVGVN